MKAGLDQGCVNMFRAVLPKSMILIATSLVFLVSLAVFISAHVWVPSQVRSVQALYPSLKDKNVDQILVFLEKENGVLSLELEQLLNIIRSNPGNNQLINEMVDIREKLVQVNETISRLILIVHHPFIAFVNHFESTYLMITPISFFFLIFSLLFTVWYGQLYSSGILHIIVSGIGRKRIMLKLVKEAALIAILVTIPIVASMVIGLATNPVMGAAIVLSLDTVGSILIYFLSTALSLVILVFFGVSLVTLSSGSVIEALTFILVYDLVLPVLIPFLNGFYTYFLIAGLRPLDVATFSVYLLFAPPQYKSEISMFLGCDPVLLMIVVFFLVASLSVVLLVVSFLRKDFV